MDELQHECGIAALYHLPRHAPSRLCPRHGPEEVSRLMPRLLLDLQNRGQLAAGFGTYNPNRQKLLDTYKQIGTVAEAFRLNHQAKHESIMREHRGRAAIGHVRYATCGASDRSSAQPFERSHGCKWKWFTFVYNGQLANYTQLRDELLSQTDYHLTRNTDTEIIMHYLSHELSQCEDKPDLVHVFQNLAKMFDGAYNLVLLNGMGDMVVLRDPSGFRPLCYAQDGGMFAAASESVALSNLGFRNVKSVAPGEIILIEDGQIRHDRIAPERISSHCFFEWIYFANVASKLDERSVYLSRSNLGRELAEQERNLDLFPLNKEDTIVVPVPDTGKAAADSMAYALGLPSVEGLIRNRYVGRTFIEGSNRAQRVRLKYTPLPEVLEGKRVLLIEDTIVRSTTLQILVNDLRERGRAKEIHVRVACPPIIAPCFYGIDMSTVKELFAPRHMEGEEPSLDEQLKMAKVLEADTLLYLPVEAIARCIGLHESRLCRGCITGEYPSETGGQLYQLSKLLSPQDANGRTYESRMARTNT